MLMKMSHVFEEISDNRNLRADNIAASLLVTTATGLIAVVFLAL